MSDIISRVEMGIRGILEHGFEVKEIKLRPDVQEKLVEDHRYLIVIIETEKEPDLTLFGFPVEPVDMKEEFKIEFRAEKYVLELGPDEEIVKSHSYTHDGLIMVSYQVVKREAAE
ncbi:hypothetical protein L3137_08850 [Bacillus sonorensis]|uniref:hypothetical protein n=1 Tax=Bacillus sonorensis TaxID=119858 RepID=UPI001F332AF8|nr:hypothetical protein [Bacillus sonorensis]MCF7617384.1 hypothetical protein [Bacillus sonorensis]